MLRAREKEAEKFARAQTYVDLARLACGLEQYRLGNGHYPETLDPLSPRFIDKLPHDVMNGQPLKYRRTDDGRPLNFHESPQFETGLPGLSQPFRVPA